MIPPTHPGIFSRNKNTRVMEDGDRYGINKHPHNFLHFIDLILNFPSIKPGICLDCS